jgi:hypothetical protein
MRWRFRAAAWAATTLLISACGGRAFDKDDLCSVYDAHPEWEAEVARVESRWGIPQELIMAVIRYESAFVGDAEAPRRRYFGLIPGERLSSAYGYSQALDQTWEEYQQRTGNSAAKRDRFGDSADFVGWYLNRTHRSLQIPRSDGYHLYLAYHQGHRGFLRRDYEQNPRLMQVARRVNTARMTYRVQLKQCRPEATEKKEKREKRFSLEINKGNL